MKIHRWTAAFLSSVLMVALSAQVYAQTDNSRQIDVQPPTEAVGTSAQSDPGSETQRSDDLGQLDVFLRVESRIYREVAPDAVDHRLHLLVTERLLADNGGRFFVQHAVRPEPEYFYPGATLHLIAALAAVHHLRTTYPQCDMTALEDVRLLIHSGRGPAVEERTFGLLLDSALGGLSPDAFDHLYDFAGRAVINRFAWSRGFRSIRLAHRMGPAAVGESAASLPRIELICGELQIDIPERDENLTVAESRLAGTDVGNAHINDEGQRVDTAMSFARRNAASLTDLSRLFAQLFADQHTDNPVTSGLLTADLATIYDAFEAYAERVDGLSRPETLRTGVTRAFAGEPHRAYSLTSRAYGFTTEVIAVQYDEGESVVVFAATIYTNANGVVNDDAYEYGTIAVPLFRSVGEALAEYYRLNRSEDD